MLAGRRERRDVPHSVGDWIEFQTLSGAQLDEAEEAQTRRSLAMVKGVDMAAVQSFTSQTPKASREEAERQRFDKDTLVRYGVVAWSAAEPCDDGHKALLDSQTRDWAVSVILEMNVRPLESASESVVISNGAVSQSTSETLLASSVEE